MRLLLLVGFLLSGCIADSGSSGKTVLIGIGSSDTISKSASGINSQDIEIIGLWLDFNAQDRATGGGFGYRKSELLAVPLDCRVVFIVKTDSQLEQAIRLTEEILDDGDEKLCVTKDG